jgi:hypothetical protein
MMKEMEKVKNWKDIQVLTGDADNDFAEMTIIHHQQATDNAQSILHHGHHSDRNGKNDDRRSKQGNY